MHSSARNAMRLHGADAELLDREQVRKLVPFVDFDNARFPVRGGLYQPRGGTVRHDAVAWGYARSADQRGVDIIQNCAVTGFRIDDGRIVGVETEKGFIGAKKVALSVAGSSSRVAEMAGLRLPIEAHVLQAFVTEGIKPLLDTVITFGAGHFYCSQSDKGGLVFGGDIDGYNTYAQRGNLPVVEDVAEGGMALMPIIGRLRLLRSWGGPARHEHGRLAHHRHHPPSTASISTPVGAMAASRPRPPPAGASPISSPPANPTPMPPLTVSIVSASAASSTRRAWARNRTCTEARPCGSNVLIAVSARWRSSPIAATRP